MARPDSPSLDLGEVDLSGVDDRELRYALKHAQEQLILQAREFSLGGILAFQTYAGRDDRGDAIEVAPIHWSWFAHVFYCWENDVIPVILAPWGHGKSVNMAIMLPLWKLGHDRDDRQKIVCNSDDNSVKRVRAIKDYIGNKPSERDPKLKAVFPNLRRGVGPWNDHAITLRRSPGAVAADCSLEAHGVFGTGIGGRCDTLVFDDLTDRRNSIEQPVLRQRVIDTAKGTWQSRLEPNGKQVEIMTRWHEEDLARDRMESPAYCVMVQRVAEGETHIDVELHHTVYGQEHPVSDRLPLWKAKWSTAALQKRRSQIGDREYARGFQQRAFADGELWFPSWNRCRKKVEIEDIEHIETAQHITGVDPAGKHRRGTAIVTVGVTRDGYRVPVDIKYAQVTSPDGLRLMNAVDAQFAPKFFEFESNSQQESWIDWAKESGYIFWPKIKAFLTSGAKKADPESGLRAMEVEFANEAWIWPLHEFVDPRTGERCDPPRGVRLCDHAGSCKCAWCEFDRQHRLYPASSATDLVMANWFIRDGIVNRLSGGDRGPRVRRMQRGGKLPRAGREVLKRESRDKKQRGRRRRARTELPDFDHLVDLSRSHRRRS